MRVLMAMPPGLLDSEHAARPVDRETRWLALRVAGAASGADAAASDAGLPRFLNFADVLVTVHRVALFRSMQEGWLGASVRVLARHCDGFVSGEGFFHWDSKLLRMPLIWRLASPTEPWTS